MANCHEYERANSVQICIPSQFDENLEEKSSKKHPNVGWPIVTNMRGKFSVQICIPPQFDENLEEKSSKKHPNVGWPIVTNMRGKFSVQICIPSQFDENMEDKSSNRRPNTFDGQLSRISRGQISQKSPNTLNGPLYISRGKFSVQICIPSQFDENLEEKSSKKHPNVGWPIVTNMRGQILFKFVYHPNLTKIWKKNLPKNTQTLDGQLSRICGVNFLSKFVYHPNLTKI
jgi:uncharacterized protein with HEPN domain